MIRYIETSTTGRYGKEIPLKYLDYESFCERCNVGETAVSRQLWILYTRQCGQEARFNELFREVGKLLERRN